VPGPSPLSWPDYAVLLASLVLLLAIGSRFARQRDTADFFLARRHIPWWAAALSFLATEISAVTIISVPATAYSENWEYVQFFVGASLAKWAVAVLFIPAFYRYNVTTIYEFLGHRFGPRSQVTASVLFFITRLSGSGVRLMAACLAVSVIFGWPLAPTIAAFSAVSIAYMAAGGVRAVVWTNVFQALIFLVAGGLTLAFIVSQVDGGLAAIFRVAGEAGRLNVVNWGPAPGSPEFWPQIFGNPNIVWVALLNGFIGSMAAFGTDQDLMQRLLTVETRAQSQRTLSITPLGTAGEASLAILMPELVSGALETVAGSSNHADGTGVGERPYVLEWYADCEIRMAVFVEVASREAPTEPVAGLRRVCDAGRPLGPNLAAAVIESGGDDHNNGGMSLDRRWAHHKVFRSAVKHHDCSHVCDRLGILKGDPDRQIGVTITVEVCGDQALAKSVKCFGLARNRVGVLGPDLVAWLGSARRRAVKHRDGAGALRASHVLPGHANREVGESVCVEVSEREAGAKSGGPAWDAGNAP
jgi:hypothetical protein